MAEEKYNWRNVNSDFRSGNILKKLPMKWIFVLIFIAFVALSGFNSFFYQVPTDSAALLLRFGKYKETVESGLHFKWPFGIETIKIIPVKRELKMEFGFHDKDVRYTNRYQFTSSEDQRKAKSMITGDTNAVNVEWAVQYRIDDPVAYSFNVQNPDDTLRDVTESIMREVVGDRSVDEVLTIGRQEIENQAKIKLETLLKEYDMGFLITQIQLIKVDPPIKVKPSFNEVNQAQQIKFETINVAKGKYNREIPSRMGTAQKNINSAEGSALERINKAKGDTQRFLELLEEYKKAPKITRQRLYLENMSEILSKIPNKVIMDSNTKNFLPFLNLNQNKMKTN